MPDFPTIRASHIARWAEDDIRARNLLAVLLRRLIHSTGRDLRLMDFPGYDNAQRRGWDGWLEAGSATQWIPEGKSGWEFGVSNNPQAKAEDDYQNRLRLVPDAERSESTFVFVTPHNWEGKNQWRCNKEADGKWKTVRAFDASDLEQWLETAPASRVWLADKLGIPTEGLQTPDDFWRRWSEASEPPMTGEIFAPSIDSHVNKFKGWLDGKPSNGPFKIAADSREEGVAFAACLLRHEEVPRRVRGRAVVFESSSALRRVAQSSSLEPDNGPDTRKIPLVPIVYSEETERELAALYRQHHCIIVRPRNAVGQKPDIAVELLSHLSFRRALLDMGIERARVDRLANESGKSPTVLRRHLSKVDAVRTPSWAGDGEVAQSLIPMALVGAWDYGREADREVVEAIARCGYQEVEWQIAGLLQRDDCPVWRVGQHRGVVSKIDALFAVSQWMTQENIVDFLDFAEYVLSESDPALELPENHRWAACLYDKVREHSGTLRDGLCETLVLLSVHGNTWFHSRLGIDVATLVTNMVERLLTPLTSDKLRSHDGELPRYAEAAPYKFIALFEKDLRQPTPVLTDLLKPVGPDFLDHPDRTGILWALECLAWNPATFIHVAKILARLSQTEIDDNWTNKPINSLSAIFRSWIPQTAAPLNDRIKALQRICRCFPDVGWQICIQQFESGFQVGDYSKRPRWRDDAADAGRGVSGEEQGKFVREALDLAISWPTHDEATLRDLITRFGGMREQDQASVWNLIEAWSKTEDDEMAKAELGKHIRRTFLTRTGRRRHSKGDETERAREVWGKLAPSDLPACHWWLFANAHVELSVDEATDEHPDHAKCQERLHELRTKAMEIWSSCGIDGVLAFADHCDAWLVAEYTLPRAADQRAAANVLHTCLSMKSSKELDNFISGFLHSVDEALRRPLISAVAADVTSEQRIRLFTCAPCRAETWRLLDEQEAQVIYGYWQAVSPASLGCYTDSETTEIVDRLLEAKRPRAAFHAVQFGWDKVETSRLKRLLTDFANVTTEPPDHYQTNADRISDAFDSLGCRPEITIDDMAQLEFAYIQVLDWSDHGIPNIERQIVESPKLFVQVLSLVFKREDDVQDPPDWPVPGTREHRASLSGPGWRLLQKAVRIPGTTDDGKVDFGTLSQWVDEARRLCKIHGRTAIGDRQIGQLLSGAPSEEDGSWPCWPVCDVMETIASADIAAEFVIGAQNARGDQMCGLDEGGGRARALAEQYRGWAKRLSFDYSYCANVLERIAESYDREAEWYDERLDLETRLGQ